MIEQKNTSTGVPVDGQAITLSTETQTPTSTATPADAKPTAPTQIATAGTLPAGYLANGSMMDADGVMLPEYLEKYAQTLAQSLKPLSASSFQRAFLSKAKEVNKKKVPYSAKKNCAQGMVIAALKLVNRKKDPAPAVLLDMIRAVTASVVDDATFSVMFTHLDAVYTFLLTE